MALDSPWMITASGRRVDLLDPQPAQIDIEDIATHLARLTRWTGATTYSVAEHSVLVSQLLDADDDLPLAGLLHDAHKAYLGDWSRPVKESLTRLGADGAVEKLISRFDAVITRKFGLPPDAFHAAAVKYADNQVLATEKRDLLVPHTHRWTYPLPPPLNAKIVPEVAPAFARVRFMGRFLELTGAL